MSNKSDVYEASLRMLKNDTQLKIEELYEDHRCYDTRISIYLDSFVDSAIKLYRAHLKNMSPSLDQDKFNEFLDKRLACLQYEVEGGIDENYEFYKFRDSIRNFIKQELENKNEDKQKIRMWTECPETGKIKDY